MRAMLRHLRGWQEDAEDCQCEWRVERDALVVDSTDCQGGGRLHEQAACRATVIDALTNHDVERVLTRTEGRELAYVDDAAAFLVAAGRFVDAVAFHERALADRARRDPLGAAHEATGRAGAVARIAAETGLAEGASRSPSYEQALRPYAGPTVSQSRVATTPPPEARLVDTRDLDTGASVRIYAHETWPTDRYHVRPVEYDLDESGLATLAAAYERLATATPTGDEPVTPEQTDGERTPGRAVRAEADNDTPVDVLTRVLAKHTRGLGVLEDLFADPAVSDAFATAPVADNPLRVRVDGKAMATNVRLTPKGAEALSSRFRRESGRGFSKASPTLDTTVSVGERDVRVAGITDPASEGVAFAFRAGGREAWTLPALVANGTLTAEAAALASLAVERGAAVLIAGPRGAGKTTLLGALLWELPSAVRTVVIEDTRELPVDALQAAGRDVQSLHTDLDGAGLSPTAALRAALRLGKGGLVVGEIRGEEAAALYEAMRVGANDAAVLGTIHGDGGADVRERVVTDLGVPESSFGVTDVLVTTERTRNGGGQSRRVRRIEEVVADDGAVRFGSLYDRAGGGLRATGRIERGTSRVVESLARPGESYADVRQALRGRTAWLEEQVEQGRTRPADLAAAWARRPADAETGETDAETGETDAESRQDRREA